MREWRKRRQLRLVILFVARASILLLLLTLLLLSLLLSLISAHDSLRRSCGQPPSQLCVRIVFSFFLRSGSQQLQSIMVTLLSCSIAASSGLAHRILCSDCVSYIHICVYIYIYIYTYIVIDRYVH